MALFRLLLGLSTLFSLLELASAAFYVEGDGFLSKARLGMIQTAVLLLNYYQVELGISKPTKPKAKHESHRQRTRKNVSDIFQEFGPTFVRRAYRMQESSFWKLEAILHPYMKRAAKTKSKKRSTRTKKHKNGARNGLIPLPTRLSCALRYFAGGSAYDIMVLHGISYSEVLKSVWVVVDAVNRCPDLDIGYPTDYDQQRAIARGFQDKSAPGFSVCAGAIDVLIVGRKQR